MCYNDLFSVYGTISTVSACRSSETPGGTRTSSCASLAGSPVSYPQVWLVSAPFVASGVLIGGLVAALSEGGFAADRFLFSLPGVVIAFAGQGTIESYRLARRKDATAYQEWLEARDRSGTG